MGPTPTPPPGPQKRRATYSPLGADAGPNSWVPGSEADGTPEKLVPGPGWVSQGGRDGSREPPRPAPPT